MTSLFLSEIVLERMFFSILEHSLLLVSYITMINQFLYILVYSFWYILVLIYNFPECNNI